MHRRAALIADGAAAVPDGFECPITQELMVDPVFATDGQSYERAAIEQWLAEHDTSPATGAALGSRDVTPNIALRKAIAAWRTQQPLAIDPARLTLLSTGGPNDDGVLGNGSFGRVVCAELATAGRVQQVAVKLLPELTHAEQRAQFARELAPHLRAMQVSITNPYLSQ